MPDNVMESKADWQAFKERAKGAKCYVRMTDSFMSGWGHAENKRNVLYVAVMDMEDVMEVTSYMMDYLIGKEEVLSIETEVEGRTQDFFNEQDRLHMEDVKNLFLGGLKLRTVMLLLAAVLVLFLILTKADLKKMLTGAYFAALGVFAILIAGLLVSFAVDFTASFTVFHEIFFTNDLWMFDPAEDYMIRMLPEGFFYDMVMRIGAFFVGGLVLLFAVMMAVRQKAFWKYRGKTGEK